MAMRQPTNPDLGAVHQRSLADGPPTAILHACASLVSAARAWSARRRSSTPPAPDADHSDSDPPGYAVDNEDEDDGERLAAAAQ